MDQPLSHYSKAIVAVLTNAVALGAMFWPELEAVISDEIIALVGGTLSAVLVYAIPNAPRKET